VTVTSPSITAPFGDGDAARDDVGVDDGGGADFQFVLNDQLAGDASRDDRG